MHRAHKLLPVGKVYKTISQLVAYDDCFFPERFTSTDSSIVRLTNPIGVEYQYFIKSFQCGISTVWD